MEKDRNHPTVDLSEGDSNLSPLRQQWSDSTIDEETRRLLEADATVFLHQNLSTPCLDVLEHCDGSFIENRQGHRYLDFHGNSVHQVGFSNPRVVKAITKQMTELSFCTRRFTNKTAIQLAEKLVEQSPESLDRVLFAPGGTTAVGMAIKLARLATGRFKTISMWDAFHGASLDAISVGGESLFRKDIGPLLPGTEHVPPPDPYRCIWRDDGNCRECGLKCAAFIEYVLEKEQDVAAIIAEPIRCTNINPPPDGFWKKVRKACDRFGTLLIFDETAVCLGKTGKMFACQVYDVTPDILTIGKGLGGGILPLAAILTKSDLNLASTTSIGHYTHEKNPVLCAAGLATLQVIEEENLLDNAQRLGIHAITRLQELMARHEIIGDVRGQGLIFGVELVKDRQTKEPAEEASERVMYDCLKNGLSFKISQGNFLTLTPPLTIKKKELDLAIDILDQALDRL